MYILTREVMQLKKPGYFKTKLNQTKPVKIMILTNTNNINKHTQLEILNISVGKMSIQ